MDKELLDLLNNARASGANESQLQGIVNAYNQKKNLGGNGGVEKSKSLSTDVLDQPDNPISFSKTVGKSSFITPAKDAFAIPSANIVTNDGATLNIPSSFGISNDEIKQVQSRVTQGTALPQDVELISKGTAKSPNVINAYLKNKDLGIATDTDESINKTKEDLKNNIDVLNKNYGTQYNADEVLSSPQKSSQFLQEIKNFRKNPIDQEKQALNQFTDLTHQDFNNIQSDLISNITKLTVDEAIKKGLSNDQTSDLLYQRIDPTGHAKTQEYRKPKSNVAKILPALNPTTIIANAYDWITQSDEKNKEALNAEKGQYELDANRGLRDLAIEKKAKAVINNDNALLEESNNLISKVQPEDNIVEKYPLLMKQKMADYVNKRFAEDAGILEGTTENGKVSKSNLLFGVNNTQAKQYLKEGGFYDNPAYKGLVDDVAEHPKTYFADNSPFGSVPNSFLKPFISVFNTASDLAGSRSEADRHSENVKEQLFPSQLTENVKNDLSIGIAGHKLNLNVANTINGVSNLAGYSALSVLTGGLGSTAGLTAKSAERFGAWATFGMDAVDSGLKEADNLKLSPAQSWLYAGMKGVMMAEGGRLLEFGKGSIPTIKGVNEDLAKAVIGISDKSLTQDAAKELLNKTVSDWEIGLKKYGISTAKGAGVLTGFGVGDKLLRIGFNDPNAKPEDILPEAANAYFNGLFTMGVMGAFGIKKNIEDAKNSTYKGMLNKIVENHDASADVLRIGLDQGLYSKGEYDKKVQILNTGVKAKATLENVIAEQGLNLTPEQQSVWVANTTAEKYLRNAAETSTTEADAKKYTEQADNLNKQSTDIVNGLTFNHLLEPQYDLHEANIELRKAQDEFSKNPTDANEKTVLEKKSALDKILYSPKDSAPPQEPQIFSPSDKVRSKFAAFNQDAAGSDNAPLIQNYRDKTGVTVEAVSDEDLLKNIAEQAQNISGGKVNETGNEESLYKNTVEQTGSKDLVDAAIAKYPKESLITPLENKNNDVSTPINEKFGDKTIETDKAVMEGSYGDEIDLNDEKVKLPEKGFLISDVNLKDGVEKGKGAGQEIYKQALDKYGTLYSAHPISEDALNAQNALLKKGLVTIENKEIGGEDFRVIKKVEKGISTPIVDKGSNVGEVQSTGIKKIADLQDKIIEERVKGREDALAKDRNVNQPIIDKIKGIEGSLAELRKENDATSDTDLLRKLAAKGNMEAVSDLIKKQQEIQDLYKSVSHKNSTAYDAETENLVQSQSKPIQEAIDKESKRVGDAIDNLSKELGAKQNDLRWGNREIDEDLGDRVGDGKSAIFIKPHETDIETTNGTETINDGLTIELVTVNPKNRGEGLAKERLKQITEAADKHGLTLFLDVASQEKNVTEEGLKKLYKEYGFEFDGIKGERKPNPKPSIVDNVGDKAIDENYKKEVHDKVVESILGKKGEMTLDFIENADHLSKVAETRKVENKGRFTERDVTVKQRQAEIKSKLKILNELMKKVDCP